MEKKSQQKISKRKILACTICCRKKNGTKGPLPAIRRYRSARINKIYALARNAGVPFAILSGKFGLLDPDDLIPDYDKLLTAADVVAVSRKAGRFLKERAFRGIIFFVPDPREDPDVVPYLESMYRAAALARIPLRVRFVPPYPRINQRRRR